MVTLAYPLLSLTRILEIALALKKRICYRPLFYNVSQNNVPFQRLKQVAEFPSAERSITSIFIEVNFNAVVKRFYERHRAFLSQG